MMAPDMVTSDDGAVPPPYRGVWQRTLLAAPGLHDVDTTVFWLQTHRWHADVRIPAKRPDFSGVQSLDACSRARCEWLARQEGFAGLTHVVRDEASGRDICRWRRLIDFRPPSALPDAGYMQFETGRLIETGVHADYLEHWQRLPGSDAGFAVLERADGPRRFLMVAGDCVMHVRERRMAWPADMPPDADMTQFGDAQLRMALDCEIAFGERMQDGWTIRHATLPWLEGQRIVMSMRRIDATSVALTWNGEISRWRVREWHPAA